MTSCLKRVAQAFLIMIGCLLLLISFIYFHGLQYLVAYTGYGFANPLPKLDTDVIANKTPATCQSGSYNVLTYNVRYGSDFIESVRKLLGEYAPGDYQPWSVRYPEIHKLIADYAPDLIGLQEMHTDHDIANIVSLAQYELLSYHLANFEYGDAALLFKKDRFESLDSGQLWLGPKSNLPLSLGFERIAVIRYANWVVLREKSTGFTFLFVNTHFDNNTINKENSADLFYEQIGKLTAKYPLVVVGDFNSRAITERYQRLIGSTDTPLHLTNAYDLLSAAKTADVSHPNDLIDHILAGGPCKITVDRWQVDKRTLANGQTLSDHNPVFAQLKFIGTK